MQPPKLLCIADGPRLNHPSDIEKCTETRKIIDQVDWDCQVLKNFSDVNLGLKKRVSSGLDWVFDTVDESIILEDDCLPGEDFFYYAQELLEKYRYDTRIMSISGNNFQFGRNQIIDSYYFSRYFHCWGWATWKRAWKYYDIHMKLLPETLQNDYLNSIFSNSSKHIKYWEDIFKRAYNDGIKTWDYQFLFSSWVQNGLHILPRVNLVSNLGFGNQSTNTLDKNNKLSNLKINSLSFPLTHPNIVMRNFHADEYTQNTIFSLSMINKIKSRIKNIISI